MKRFVTVSLFLGAVVLAGLLPSQADAGLLNRRSNNNCCQQTVTARTNTCAQQTCCNSSRGGRLRGTFTRARGGNCCN